MEIKFESTARAKGGKSRGRGKVVYDIHGYRPVVFNNGFYSTTDKQEVQRLLHSRIYADQTIQLVTDMELVNDYLEGNQPDKLTAEILKGIDAKGLRKIAEVERIPEHRHKNYEGVLRSMLKGTPITSIIMNIIKEHQLEEVKTDKLEEAMEAGVIYRSGPWYKYKKGEEEDKSEDLSLGRTEQEAHEWIAKNEDKLKDRI